LIGNPHISDCVFVQNGRDEQATSFHEDDIILPPVLSQRPEPRLNPKLPSVPVQQNFCADPMRAIAFRSAEISHLQTQTPDPAPLLGRP